MMHVLSVLAAAEEPTGIGALGLDPWALLAQGATFLLLLVLLKKFAFTKIVSTLEQRRTTIDESLQKAEELSRKNAEAELRVSELLHQARKEAEEIINKSHEEAGSILQAAEDQAVQKAEKIIKDGKAQIEQEVVKAKDAIKAETLDLVARATGVLLGEVVDVKKHEQLVKKALDEVKS